jgi:hypothetical protein
MGEAKTGQARGRCQCGRVRFVAHFPSRFVAHCHCESCRRAHSAAFVTWVGFNSPQVEITAGVDQIGVHESSPGTFRKFCRACGTKLFFEGGKWPGETHIALAAFDDPVDRAPQGHAFYAEHVAWLPELSEPPAP